MIVFEGIERRLKCIDTSEGEPVIDAEWFRVFPNGTVHQFRTSGSVKVQLHFLYFLPFVRPEYQGIYYCCKPKPVRSCSGNSTVAIAGIYAMHIIK